MDFEYSPKTQEFRARVRDFMDRYVIPNNTRWREEVAEGRNPPPVVDELKALARSEGLWNMFLPGLKPDEPGTRLSNLEYAPLAEIMGRLLWASEVFNCSAPDTGNMELLHLVRDAGAARALADPLLNGEIRSCFAMTEPDVASSDATNIATRIERDGDDYVINGRKWFITGAAAFALQDRHRHGHHQSRRRAAQAPEHDPDADGYARPRGGAQHQRDEPSLGRDPLRNRVPQRARAADRICWAKRARGFALAQARLGPGRIHHCMRTIGQCELALDLMVLRAQERKTFGKYLHEHGVVAEWIALSRCEIEQARLLVLKAAWMIDEKGAKAAASEISMIKAMAPRMQTAILDRAMQTFGAMGLSPDTPLADLWTTGRTLRIADGPDEVHLRSIAQTRTLARAQERRRRRRLPDAPARQERSAPWVKRTSNRPMS